MTECLTISRIALTKFLNYYLKESKIPLINKFKIFNFIYFFSRNGAEFYTKKIYVVKDLR